MTEDPRGPSRLGAEPGLFDLPLEPLPPPLAEELSEDEPQHVAEPTDAASARSAAGRIGGGAGRPESLPLFDQDEPWPPLDTPRPSASRPPLRLEALPSRPAATKPGAAARPAASRPLERDADTVPMVTRLLGSGGDLVVVGAAGAVAALGARYLGAPIGFGQLAPLALFLLAWSFVYFVVPLAFWGATPGMSWAGVVAKTSPTEPLSFGQAAMRWLGTWLTWASLGLGGLLALTGRSLADRISGSSTHPQLHGAG